ncbi:DUF58 domain-containing protein [Carbonactinospora thermoautotrophica]|uniref:DUF58 domain-containing protein n=1 Tax=Carbonactinospora thermoautotrophica TaxID=1469144 RepID=UPI00226D53AA|nr:DUF58 domain-containing protein [Carbonactinospora thermoautotrophica]MCX9190775.1 DUF58 domain-containing protein [Carbonactinospora thermoautotrophica]
MREALSGLTTRGRAFLSAGMAAAVCAVLFGERDLLRVGILLTALPMASAFVVARTRYRVACVRRLEPSRVPAGCEAWVILRMDNLSRLPTGLLLVEDRIPYVLGSRPRFVLDRVEPRGSREVAYRVRSDVRGRFSVGPLTVRLTDPFGLVELNRAFSAKDTLTVTPAVQALPHVRLGGERTGRGESLARSVAVAGEDDVTTREYRHGDDMRRVHWRSTARYGELMVRREEQPWQSRCSLLLDTRRRAHRGDGPGSSFEWAVSAVASIGLHLSRRGYATRLLTDVETVGATPDPVGVDFENMLLDTLAAVRMSGNKDLRAPAEALRHSGGEDLLVAVLGHLDAAEAEKLVRLRHGAGAAIAVLMNTAAWSPRPIALQQAETEQFDANVRLLRAGGWRVLTVRPGDSLPALWPLAGKAGYDGLAARGEGGG